MIIPNELFKNDTSYKYVAQQMITEVNHSIKSVAPKTGYKDAYAFSKQFKKNVGISPTEFIAN